MLAKHVVHMESPDLKEGHWFLLNHDLFRRHRSLEPALTKQISPASEQPYGMTFRVLAENGLTANLVVQGAVSRILKEHSLESFVEGPAKGLKKRWTTYPSLEAKTPEVAFSAPSLI